MFTAETVTQLEETKVNSWFDDLVKDEHELDLELSAKFSILMEIMRAAETVGDKVLVFSQSLLTLNLLESLIQEEQFGGFCLGIDYYRLDGSSAADSRQSWAQNFNKKRNRRLRLFLISTRAGSLGVNLVGANRVVLMDASWNPTHDTQSLFRVYRFGQEKPVYIYRLIAQVSLPRADETAFSS
jgi:transcriptional regulator ATRX